MSPEMTDSMSLQDTFTNPFLTNKTVIGSTVIKSIALYRQIAFLTLPTAVQIEKNPPNTIRINC